MKMNTKYKQFRIIRIDILLLSFVLLNSILWLSFSEAVATVATVASVSQASCQLQHNCHLDDGLLSLTANQIPTPNNPNNLEKKIAPVFADKVNYSLKLFADETIIQYSLLERNLSEIATNFTFSQPLVVIPSKDDNDIDVNEKGYLQSIAQRFVSVAQPFDASHHPQASENCRRHTKRYLEGLQNFELWALKLHDATGKITSGILNGNINQHGDYDECLSVQHSIREDDDWISNTPDGNDDDDDNLIKGQYCLAYAQPVFDYKSKRLQTIFDLMQSHEPFHSEFNDPGHRVPRYSLINWGICIPAACSYQDVEYVVKEYLNNVTASTGVSFKVRVEPQMCQTSNANNWDRNTIWAARFFVMILAITVLSTIYHQCTKNNSQQNEWLTVFALDKNLKWIFETKESHDDISAVHGIRFMNAIMLLLSHKSMAMFFNPYNNRTEMSESLGRPWTVIGRAASLYTDPFLLLSGMLTSYSLFGRLNKGQSIRLKNEYINRLIRIIPPLAALILFCTYILPMLGSGPQWNLVVGHHATICKRNWWRNLLFIHNYFGFSEMCLTHTHHLGIDTELFAVAPLMILVLWKWPKAGIFGLLSLCAIGTAGRYYTTIYNELSNYIYFGTNIQRLFRTADYMYSFPPMRSTVYIMGIFLGYLLRKYPNIKLSKSQVSLGWSVATACLLASLLGPAPMGDINYKYNRTHAAIYAAFAPIAWCTFFSWMIFASHNGYSNSIVRMFSWSGYQVSTKLSYAIYLTQFPVYFYNVGRRRHIHHYYNFISTICDTNEYICIFLASVILTVLFDAPFQNIKKLLLKRSSNIKATVATNITSPAKHAANATNPIRNDAIASKLLTKILHSD